MTSSFACDRKRVAFLQFGHSRSSGQHGTQLSLAFRKPCEDEPAARHDDGAQLAYVRIARDVGQTVHAAVVDHELKAGAKTART
jgi:hypothetical protein